MVKFMAKTADEARANASKVKAQKMAKGKYPKGGGKGLSGDALVGRVSQATIDDIKRMGMTEALKLAGKNGPTAGGMAREFQEGVRRMYGAQRLAAAKSKYSGTATKPGSNKSADAARAGSTKPATKAAIKAVSTKGTTKVAPKKDNTKSNVLKASAGTAAALGLLAVSKGKGASLAAKLSPAVGSLAKSGIGKALIGKAPKISPEAFNAMKAAKAGKAVSESGYKAMQAAAKAAGKTAAKTTAKTTTKAAAKAPAKSADAARAMATIPKKKIAVAGMASQSNKK